MSKDFTAVWLGDEDPLEQVATVGGLRFVKGEKVTVPADNPMAAKIRGNPMFAVDGEKAEPVESIEAEQPEESGTERAALLEEAHDAGLKLQGQPSAETIRRKLAEHLAKQQA